MSEEIYSEEDERGVTVFREVRPNNEKIVVRRSGGNTWFIILIVIIFAIVGILIIAGLYARGVKPKKKYHPSC